MTDTQHLGVGLGDAIQSLRKELEAAMHAGYGSGLRFEAAEIELVLESVVTRGGEVGAGVKWWLVDANGTYSQQGQTTQKITLKLVPATVQPDGILVKSYLAGSDTDAPQATSTDHAEARDEG